jgi:hypothetical protein
MPNEISEIVGTKVVHRSADFLLADGKSGQFKGAMSKLRPSGGQEYTAE